MSLTRSRRVAASCNVRLWDVPAGWSRRGRTEPRREGTHETKRTNFLSELILFHFSRTLDAKICMAETERRVVVSNRRARHEFHMLETFEAGIVLKGTEVKSLRQGNANLQDSYAVVKNGEVWLHNMHVSPYEKGNINNHDPLRTRKLLLHRKQIRKLIGNVREKGLTLVPLSVYFSGPHAKVELALAQGKKQHDKREATARRDAEREMRQRMKRSIP